MKDPKKREMFSDLYRLAEYYEAPQFKPGDVEGNSQFFVTAINEQLGPFLKKYQDMPLASKLALAIMDECNDRAVALNKMGGA